MTESYDDVACTICGCVCDDLRVTVREGRIIQAEGACFLSERWFLEQDTVQPPVAEINGRAVDVEAAIESAATILRESASPLIYGLSRSSTDGQRAATALADRLGATIDTTASLCHAPSILALQQVGESTCSLGEIRNRADLVIYWGSNPAESHPRHWERYAVCPTGEFIPHGRADRTLVVADVQPTRSTEQADLVVPVEPGRDFEALWTLRALVRGLDIEAAPAADSCSPPYEGGAGGGRAEGALPSFAEIPPNPPLEQGENRKERRYDLRGETSTGAPLPILRELAARMKSCRCGVIFFGLGLTRSPLGHRNVEALLRLVTDLNDYTRFHARRMRVPGDVAGADSVLCWQTGYPFSVNLSRGYPRYNPGEFSANDLLERGEVDACLLVGSEGVDAFSPQARDSLQTIPTIALDHPTVPSHITPTVRFTTAVYGIHLPGTAYRMDETPIPLRPVLPRQYPSDGDVLRSIEQRLRST